MNNYEIWKKIPGFDDDYEISNIGRIRSSKRSSSRILKQPKDNKGYKFLGLRSNGKSIIVRTHRLVMLAFVGRCPDGMEVCHNDGDKENNILENLRYDTHRENTLDTVEHGMYSLTIDDIISIRQSAKHGVSVNDLSIKYNVSIDIIYSALKGESYIRANKIEKPLSAREISKLRAIEIRKVYNNGKTITKISKMFNVSISLVSRIVNNKVHT